MGIDKDIKRVEKYVENLIHDYVDPKAVSYTHLTLPTKA